MTQELRAAACPGSMRQWPLPGPAPPPSWFPGVWCKGPWLDSLVLSFSSGSAVGHQMKCSPSLCLGVLICKIGCQSHNATSEDSLGFLLSSILA